MTNTAVSAVGLFNFAVIVVVVIVVFLRFLID